MAGLASAMGWCERERPHHGSGVRLGGVQVTVYYDINKVSDVKRVAADLKAAPTLQPVQSRMQKDGARIYPSWLCSVAMARTSIANTCCQNKRAHMLRMTHLVAI